MEYGFVHLPIIPLRVSPDDRSELISQALFGEVLEILEKTEKWWLVRLEADKYSGYVDPRQVLEIGKGDYEKLKWTPQFKYSAKSLNHAVLNGKKIQFLPFGCALPPKSLLNTLNIKLDYHDADYKATEVPDGRHLVDMAEYFLGAPYLWGGKSLAGLDCSGFVQLIYKCFGIILERDASVQARSGRVVSFISEAQAGDLAFFDDEEGNIIHVGILDGEDKIIHASGEVRKDNIDHQGIFNAERNKYTHKLRLINRYLGW